MRVAKPTEAAFQARRSENGGFVWVGAMQDGLTLSSILLVGSGLFCLSTLFFGTKGGFYDSDDYDGNGTAH